MSLTAAAPVDHDIRNLPPYLAVKEDRSLTAGPDSKFIAQQILNVRQSGLPAFDFAPIVQYVQFERQLDGLLRAKENDDFGPVRPPLSAVHAILRMLLRIAAAGYVIPAAEDVDTDHDGNIRISWRAGSRFLELVTPFAPSQHQYLYHSEGATFNIEPVDSSEILKNWLNWAR